MHWFAGFASKPQVQFSGRRGDEAAFALYRHPFVRPTLNHGDRLPQKRSDLLPAFQQVGNGLRGRPRTSWDILASRRIGEKWGTPGRSFWLGLLILFWHSPSMHHSGINELKLVGGARGCAPCDGARLIICSFTIRFFDDEVSTCTF